MKELRRKSKTILFTVLVMCSILGSIEIKAQPQMGIDYIAPIVPGESIYVKVFFEFENTWQMLKSDIMVYYETSKQYSSYEEVILIDNKPELVTTTISTYGLDLEDGDHIWITVVCDWGNLVSVQGTLEEYATVSVYEEQSSLRIGTIIGIASSIFALILIIITILIRRRKRKKRMKYE